MKNGLVMPIKDMVLFSGGQIKINIDHEIDYDLELQMKAHDHQVVIVSLREGLDIEHYQAEDLYSVGNLVKIEKIKRQDEGYQLTLNVLDRVHIDNISVEGQIFMADYVVLEDEVDVDQATLDEILKYIKSLTAELSQSIPGSEGFVGHIKTLKDINEIIAALMPYVPISTEEKQELLEMVSLKEKSLRFLDIMNERREHIKFQVELNSKMNNSMNKTYREKMLREQMAAIQEELDGDQAKSSKKDYRLRISEAHLPEAIEEIALDEVSKLEQMGASSPEANVVRNYLDLILSLPWQVGDLEETDIVEAKVTLNKRHYGLEKVKARIIQHLTVMKLKKNKQGSILLLVGPPGTGKTSLAKSIAEALGREYVRISLGGVRDEAEIRGHRRTYIGAMPGRIIQGMKRAGSKNSVFVLDEIDKLMASNAGDPASALLEVLDPEQNNTFNDHYLDAPYDLSDVFFIATANDLRTIPGPLRDRLEIIQIGSYTGVEKFHIAVDHLWDISLEDHGLSREDIKVSDNAMRAIVDRYTREAGVRNLKRQLDKLVRVSSEKIVTGKVEKPYRIRENMLNSLLGHEPFRYDRVKESNSLGVVTGLAWTPVGGDILYVESAFIPGKGQLILTGQLGDVMKESARISLSLIKSRLHTYMTPEDYAKVDLHIHVPSGSTPKDGPSAGITLLTTLASLVTKRPVDAHLAMTGEISLRGAVLPVGGIKEKVIAAHRSGIKKVLLPIDNKRDLEDLPSEVKQDMDFVLVETIDDVLKEALSLELAEAFTQDFILSTKNSKNEIGFNMLKKY